MALHDITKYYATPLFGELRDKAEKIEKMARTSLHGCAVVDLVVV